MRIIGQIEHPSLKISVFKMENRLSVKFENEAYEQTFKLGADEQLNNLESIKTWVDQQLLEDVLQRMEQMHQSSLAARSRAFPASFTGEFEAII